MKIHAGFEIVFDCAQPTPMLLALNIHASRRRDLLTPQTLRFDPGLPASPFRDAFGNDCTRIVAPAGATRITTDFAILDGGRPDPQPPAGTSDDIADLPDDVLMYLLGSRYCDTDRLADMAWSYFGPIRPGIERVKAICDFVHNHLTFNYGMASSQRSALDAWRERTGVCRDFAHLAIALCRCVNIPARYCTGYLGDIGVPPDPAPMDFSAWFEVWLDGAWYPFDARHNRPRIGRILMATGRDATDVALSTSFGAARLTHFSVTAVEVRPARVAHGDLPAGRDRSAPPPTARARARAP
jgi:transglutaminase-like putative cysteine protease